STWHEKQHPPSMPVIISPSGELEINSGTFAANSLIMTGGVVTVNAYLQISSNLISYPTPLGTATIGGPGFLDLGSSTSSNVITINVTAGKLDLVADAEGYSSFAVRKT